VRDPEQLLRSTGGSDQPADALLDQRELERAKGDLSQIARLTGQSPQRALSGRRVLVVDDDEDCREGLAMVLEIAGAEVRTAADGLAGLELAADFEPEIVLLDIRMPKLDGYEAARQLRAGPRGDALILIALTGSGQPEHVEKSRIAGFDEHLTKPVEPDSLLKLIENIKPRAQAERSIAVTT